MGSGEWQAWSQVKSELEPHPCAPKPHADRWPIRAGLGKLLGERPVVRGSSAQALAACPGPEHLHAGVSD